MSEIESPTTEPYVTPPASEHLTPEGTIKPEEYVEKGKPEVRKVDVEVDTRAYRPVQRPRESQRTPEGQINPHLYVKESPEEEKFRKIKQKEQEQFKNDVSGFNQSPETSGEGNQKQGLRQKIVNFFKKK